MESNDRNRERLALNAASKTGAENDGEAYGRTESELILLWDRTEETLSVLAELIGRTREATRQRFYELERGDRAIPETEVVRGAPGRIVRRERTVTTTETERSWTYENWPEDERSPYFR